MKISTVTKVAKALNRSANQLLDGLPKKKDNYSSLCFFNKVDIPELSIWLCYQFEYNR